MNLLFTQFWKINLIIFGTNDVTNKAHHIVTLFYQPHNN